MLDIIQIFNERTCYNFLDKSVNSKILKDIYDLMKLGPTSLNGCPLRMIFVTSKQEKEKLYTCLMEGNIGASRSAPVNVIFSYDLKFYEKLPKLFPHKPQVAQMFIAKPDEVKDTAYRNSTLQAAYFMIIARSFGLSCGPMSGFSMEKVDKNFHANTDWRANFICNVGYRAGEDKYPRLPRFDFDEVCKII